MTKKYNTLEELAEDMGYQLAEIEEIAEVRNQDLKAKGAWIEIVTSSNDEGETMTEMIARTNEKVLFSFYLDTETLEYVV